MNTPPLTEIEAGLSEYQRRVSVDAHLHFQKCISVDDREIDEDFDDLVEIDPYVTGTNNRRSDRDLAKMLELIDNLPISENGKEGSH
jgi:hypothetical protein